MYQTSNNYRAEGCALKEISREPFFAPKHFKRGAQA